MTATLPRHPLHCPLDLSLLAATAAAAAALVTAPLVPLDGPAAAARKGLVLGGAASAIALQSRWRGWNPSELFVGRARATAMVAQQLAAEAEARAQAAIAAKEAEQEALYAKWQEQADQQAAEMNRQMEETRAQADAAIAGYAQQLAAATAPKTFSGADLVSFCANQIQEILWQFEVPCDADRCVETDTEHYVWLRPRQTTKLRDVQAAAAEIPHHVDGIFDAPTVTMERGLILLRYPFNQPAARAQSKAREESLIVDGFDWVRSCVLDSVHDLVAGQTGSGKSTLIANLLDLAQTAMAQEWGESPVFWIVDPKWPDSEWRLGGVPVDPHYRGFDRYVAPDGQEYPAAIDGYRAMSDSVDARLKSAKDDWFYTRETYRTPEVWVLDEGEQMAANYGLDAAGPVGFVARIGRSTRVRLILIGQSPKCSSYGFKQKAQLNNFSRYFLGEAIPGAIDEIGRTTVEKNRMRKTLQKMEAIALTDESRRYFALVKQPSRPAYFAYLPPPGYFLRAIGEEAIAPPVAAPSSTASAPIPAPPHTPPTSDRALLDLVAAAAKEEEQLREDQARRDRVIQWKAANPDGRLLDLLADCWPEIRVKAADGTKSGRGYRVARNDLARLFPDEYPL